MSESAHTVRYRGLRFDIGGDRFFAKNREVKAFWAKILGSRLRWRGWLSLSVVAA